MGSILIAPEILKERNDSPDFVSLQTAFLSLVIRIEIGRKFPYELGEVGIATLYRRD